MPRNGSGTFAAPANSWNPPVLGDEMDPDDWQETLDDIESGITGSIAANGETATTAVIPLALGARVGPGSAAAPSLAFIADTNTGIYRISADVLGMAVGGAEAMRLEAALAQISLPQLLIDYNSMDLSLTNSGEISAQLKYERSGAGAARIEIDPVPSDGAGAAEVALFRDVDTTGAKRLSLYKGNGSAETAATMTVNGSANGADWTGIHKWPGTYDQPMRYGETRLWRGSEGHPRWLSSATPASASGGLPFGIIAMALATPGYVNIGGFIVQWGTGTTDSNGEVAVTFPTAFPSALVYSNAQRPATSSNVGCVQASPTTTGVTFRLFITTDGSSIGAGLGIRWFAMGY